MKAGGIDSGRIESMLAQLKMAAQRNFFFFTCLRHSPAHYSHRGGTAAHYSQGGAQAAQV